MNNGSRLPRLLVLPAVGLAVGFAINLVAVPRHEAQLVLRIGMTGVPPTENIVPIEQPAAAAERINSAGFQAALQRRLDHPLTRSLLPRGDQLRARPLVGTHLVELKGTSPSAERARSIVVQAAAQVGEQHQREIAPTIEIYARKRETRLSELKALNDELVSIGMPAELKTELARAPRADSTFLSTLIATTRRQLADAQRQLQDVETVVALPRTHPTAPLGEAFVSTMSGERPAWLAPVVGLLAGLVLAVAVFVARQPRR